MPDTPNETGWDTSKYLADPAQLAERTGADPSDPALLLALERATNRFIGAIGYRPQHTPETVFYLSGDGGRTLALPVAPIGTPRVFIDGAELPPGAYSVARRAGILCRRAGWPDGLENIEVRVSYGYEEIPGDIQDAVLEAAEIGSTILPGVDSITTGDETIRFHGARSGGRAAGVTALWADTVEKYRLGWEGDGT